MEDEKAAKRREYAHNYYQKHKQELQVKHREYRAANIERAKMLRHERWLIRRYIPEEVQRAILYDDIQTHQLHNGPQTSQSEPVDSIGTYNNL